MKTSLTRFVPALPHRAPASWTAAAHGRFLLALFCALVLAAALPRAQAAGPPEAMTYQGFLVDANGNALAPSTPANYPVIFRIFPTTSGGASLWSEQQIVTVDKGNFSVILSEGTPVPGEPKPLLSTVLSTNGADRYVQLSVTIGANTPDMLPRLRLLPSPYSFLATSANNLVSPSGVPVIRYGNSRVEVTGDISASGVISGNGSGLTGLTAGQVTGTFADNQFPPNVARRDAGNAFTGNQTMSGNLGVGTVGTGFPLTIGNNSIGDKLSLFGQSGNSFGFGIAPSLLQIHTDFQNSDIAFGFGSSAAMTETMRIKGSGNVGIGLNNPSGKLTINGGVRARGGAPGGGGVSDNGYAFTGNGGDNDSGIFSSADGQVEFYSNGAERMRVAAGGNVGIGTTTPTAKLDVNGSIKSTGITVDGNVTATTFNGTVNGEKVPLTFTVPTTLTGNLTSYREVMVDTAALLGDANGGRIQVRLRNHSNKTVRTYSIEFYAEQETDFSKPTADGRYFWAVDSYGNEAGDQLIGKGGNFRIEVAPAPWAWMYIRNYSSGVATGTGDGAAGNFDDRYKFYFLVAPNITATVTIYDR